MSSFLLVFLAANLILAVGDPRTDLDRLKGSWRVVAVEQDSKPLTAPKKVTWVFSDLDLSIGIAGRIKSKDRISLAPSITPKAINRYFTAAIDGGFIQSTARGIYRLDDDTLFVCFGEPNEDRPTEFAPKPGSRTTLVVLKRAGR